MEDVERAHILKILVDCNWKINGEDGAANRLGLNPSTLRSRLKKLQIERHV
jgi:transcriptional regulator with GAF, ATPase, and Fis domain